MAIGNAGDEPSKQGAIQAARALLGDWLQASIGAEAGAWLAEALAPTEDRQAIDLAFGLAPRRLGKRSLSDDAERRAHAAALLPGWDPSLWAVDEAARVLIAAQAADVDGATLDRLARHADIAEQVALYRGLPLYGPQLDLHDLLGRGLRTHATPVFQAIAHRNPWPAAHLDEHRWNHLVLKALFMEISLTPLIGLQARANPALSRMAQDYADERRAAGRQVPDDLWHCVRPEDTPHTRPGQAA